MNPQFRQKYQIYVLGLLFTLSVISLIGMNVFLSANNDKLREEHQAARLESRIQKVYLELKFAIRHGNMTNRQGLNRALEEIYNNSGLLSLRVISRNNRYLFAHSTVAIPESAATLMTRQSLQQERPLPDDVSRTPVTLPGGSHGPTVLCRAILYSPAIQPDFYLYFMVQSPAMAGVSSSEQLVILFQTIFVLTLLALFWYFIRRLVRPYETLIREIKSSPLESKSAPAPIHDEISYLVGSFKGVINQLREKEQQLQEMHRQALQRADSSEKFARDILAGIKLGVVSLDGRGIFLDCNPVFEALLGKKKIAFRNVSYHGLFAPNPGLVPLFDAFFKQPETVSATAISFIAGSGEELLMDITLSPLNTPQGDFYGVICTMEDVTEASRLRQRLQVRENLAALGEMAAGIAHELKNSLATISGYGQMLLGNARPGAEQKRAAALVQEVEDTVRVISDFLDYARPVQADKNPLSIDELMTEVVAGVRDHYPRIEFRQELIPVRILGEAYLLKKAFQNLMLNAVQALDTRKDDEPGMVTVRMEMFSGNVLGIHVTDNGPGMDAKTLSRIFTPFFTTRPEGTGMGLAVVQKIVAIHEGTIEVWSELGEGTTVELKFPVVRESAAPRE